jgi:hypothetical protein
LKFQADKKDFEVYLYIMLQLYTYFKNLYFRSFNYSCKQLGLRKEAPVKEDFKDSDRLARLGKKSKL